MRPNVRSRPRTRRGLCAALLGALTIVIAVGCGATDTVADGARSSRQDRQGSASARDAKASGDVLFARGDYARAARAYRAAARRGMDTYELSLRVGLCYLNGYDDTKRRPLAANALEAFDTALEFDPRSADALYNRAMVLFRLKRLVDFPWRDETDRLVRGPSALDAAARLVHFHPDEPSGYYVRGLVLEALGDPDNARADFDRYVELGGDEADIVAAHLYVTTDLSREPVSDDD